MIHENEPMIMPIVTLELQQMKYKVQHYLHVHNEDLNKRIDAACDKAFDSYDLHGEVTRAINFAITEAIKEYFQYGKGNTAIKHAIEEMFNTEKPPVKSTKKN